VGELDADGVRHERGHLLLTVRGKGGTVHELPVHAWLGERLTSYLHGRSSGPLLLTHSGARLTRWQVRRTVERVCKVAGVPQVHPHALRHAAVTLALQAGAPLHRVQDLARHASPVTTRRYDDAVGRLDGHASYALGDALVGAA
jgi:integrase/recombinase XerD